MTTNKKIALRMEYILESEDSELKDIPKYADWLEARLVRISDEVELTDSDECKKITFLRD
jgi:exosome complex RNA-binding protein Csl4